MPPLDTLTAERLRELLHYDPETGIFTWIKRSGPCSRIGAAAGTLRRDCRGYSARARVYIKIDRVAYAASRLAWLYMTGEWPSLDIDHINGNPLDNRFANLREATKSRNLANSRRYITNRSGYKGVSWNKANKKWHATIQREGERAHLGYFDSPKDAHNAYCIAANILFKEYARFA